MGTWGRAALALILTLGLGAGFWALTRSPQAPVSPDLAQESAETPEESPSAAPVTDLEPATADTDPTPASLADGPGSLTITILGENDEPQSGAEVHVEVIAWSASELPTDTVPEAERTTDDAGRVQWSGIALARYGVTARHGHLAASVVVHLTDLAPKQEKELSLKLSGRIAGTVLDSAREPIEGVWVYPEHSGRQKWSSHQATPLRAKTGVDGRFELQGLTEEEYVLVFQAPGYAVTASDPVPLGSEDGEYLLSTGEQITGVVLHIESREPVAGVHLRLEAPLGRDEKKFESDAEGAFSFADLGPNEYQLTVSDPKYLLLEPETVSLDLGLGPPGPVELFVELGGEIAGRITDEATGLGIAGVPVIAHSDSGHARSRHAKSGDDGTYVLTGLAEGNFYVSRQRFEGYPDASWQDRKLVSAKLRERVSEVDFRLLKGLPVRGRVLDPDGNGVAAAEVNGTTSNQSTWQRVKTDDEGNFEIYGLDKAGSFFVKAQKDGLADPQSDTAHTFDPEAENYVEIQMIPEAVIAGVVLDAAGNPLEGYRVTLRQSQVQRHSFSSSSVPLTKEDGRFRAGGLVAGTYELRLQRADQWSWNRSPNETVELEAGEYVEDLRLVYEEGDMLEIHGVVRDLDGEPISGASVNAYSANGSNSHVMSGQDGVYRLQSLKDAVYTVQVFHQKYTTKRQSGVAAGSRDIDIVLSRRGTVEGRVVRSDGEPVTDYEIQVLEGRIGDLQPWMSQGFTKVHDAEGKFSLNALQVGDSTLAVRAKGAPTTFVLVLDVASGETRSDIEVVLEAARSATGLVVDARGKPVAEALIYIGAVPQYNAENAFVARTAEDGTFAIDTLGSGLSRISAAHPGFAHASGTVHPAEGKSHVRIQLDLAGVLRGTVYLDGKPRGGGWVHVSSAGGAAVNLGVNVNPDGTYEVGSVPPGEVTVQSTLHDPATGRSESIQLASTVEAGGTRELDISFETYDSILEGRVIGVENAQRLFVRVMVGGRSYQGQAKSDGSFRFEGLPAGEVSLHVNGQAEDGSWIQRSIKTEILSGQVNYQDITLVGGAAIVGRVQGVEDSPVRMIAALHGEHEIEAVTPELFVKLQSEVAATEQIDENGDYNLKNLEPGKYTVVAIAMDRQPQGPADFEGVQLQSAIVEVGDRGEQTLNLVMPPAD